MADEHFLRCQACGTYSHSPVSRTLTIEMQFCQKCDGFTWHGVTQPDKDPRPRYEFKTAGHTHDDLSFFPGPSRCGHICDGVGFEHGDEGGWNVAYDDLVQMYELAKAARDLTNTPKPEQPLR